VSEEVLVAAPKRAAWWRRVSRRMAQASHSFGAQLKRLVVRRTLDDEFFDSLTEVLIGADCGVQLAGQLVESLREVVKRDRLSNSGEAVQALRHLMLAVFAEHERALNLAAIPSVVLLVGVNGSGKTTTAGKLAHRLRDEGRSVLVAAADTYRAAAIDQMRVWANSAGADLVAHQPGGDPGAVVFDALQAANARRVDCVVIDTAGRLHTKANLMDELAKLKRVIQRQAPGAPHESLMVLDAPTGQNGFAQAKMFNEAIGLTGVALTKLDGTAKGGIIVRIVRELKLPVTLVGVGEKIDDLQPFDPARFVDALVPE